MQDLFYPLYNKETNEYMQVIISSSNRVSRNMLFRLEYGCIFATLSSRYSQNTAIKKIVDNSFLTSLYSKFGNQFHSALLFKEDGKGYIHALGERIDLDYSPNIEKQINDSSKYISSLLKKHVKPMIESCLKRLNIEGISYKISITSSVSYIGQLSSKRTPSSIRKFSYTPLEIVGKEYVFRFSWFLGLFSLPIIESVVIHEVVHCLEQHHTKNFYSIVYSLCPNYDYYHECLVKGYVKGANNEL